ncbi:MAG: hypothetical protein J5I98_24140 [Phaeodactylibacter sp.]|nr:hypothetical protein [Phaeodactylibacter sp.]
MLPQQKIFGIGFHKTGTRSLTQALQKLGIKATHWPYKLLAQLPPDASKEEVLKVLAPVLEANQSFADVPYSGLYRELDYLFPDSKFILTKRDSESWWDSISRHWSLGGGTRILTPYERIQYNQFPPAISEATLADEVLLAEKFETHNRTVQAYFEQRPEDLLIIDWESESHSFSWERLCAFLEVDLPEDTSVPWIRKGRIPEVKAKV